MTKASYTEGFGRAKALVLGDVMLDAYLWGRVDRISPEAPVPVVHVKERSARLGGAGNVALNMLALGAKPLVVSVVGDDQNADALVDRMKAQGLDPSGLLRSRHRRTTVKTRVISGHQHIVRVDEEQEDPLEEEDVERTLKAVARSVEVLAPDVVVFEDYDKGALTPDLINEVVELCRGKGIPTTVDPKKRNFKAYVGVDLFKPNLKELREGTGLSVDPTDRDSVKRAVSGLRQGLHARIGLVTLSEHGVHAQDDEQDVFVPAHPRSIADVSGAGDTVIAVASLLLAQGADLRTLAAWSNLAGGLVCEHVGVVPIDPVRFAEECAAI